MHHHEVCDIFPMMGDDEFKGLVEDLAKHGLREPIWTHDGKVIDGRNRLRACKILGIEPVIREWDGNGSLVAFVVSLNLHRRHLSEGQRAMVAAKIKPMFEEEAKARQAHGQTAPGRTLVANLPPLPDKGKSRDKAAQSVNVSPRSVESASKVLKNGTPDLVKAVESGEVGVSVADAVSELPKGEQVAVVAGGGPAIKAKAKQVKKARATAKASTNGKSCGYKEVMDQLLKAIRSLQEVRMAENPEENQDDSEAEDFVSRLQGVRDELDDWIMRLKDGLAISKA